MGNLPHTLVSSVVWGSKDTPLLMFSWFPPERSSTRRFLLWRCKSRLLPSLPSICQRKTDSVLTWKKDGDVKVSNRHWQRCMWRNSWKILPKLVTFRLKRKASIYHMQMAYIITSDCDRKHRNLWSSQKAPMSSIPAIPDGEHRLPCSASLGSHPGSQELILLPKMYPVLFFGYSSYLKRCGFTSLGLLLCHRRVSSCWQMTGLISWPDSLCQFQHEGKFIPALYPALGWMWADTSVQKFRAYYRPWADTIDNGN